MIRSVAMAAVLACAVASGPAIANEPMIKFTGRVKYGDLNLADPHHLGKLHGRVAQVAQELCTRGLDEDWFDHPEVTACQARIVADARSKIANLASGAIPSSTAAMPDSK